MKLLLAIVMLLFWSIKSSSEVIEKLLLRTLEVLKYPFSTFPLNTSHRLIILSGVASQQGTLTLPNTWFRPPFWDLLMLQLLRPNSSNLPCLYSTFHLEYMYPLVLYRFCLSKQLCCLLLTGVSIESQKRASLLRTMLATLAI